MTQPTSEEPFPPQFPVVQEAPAPFEDYVKIELTKPINQDQLIDEINKAGKSNVTLAVSGPINGNEEISERNPAELYVSPSKVGEKKVKDVVGKHSAVIEYGVPETERRFAEVMEKVAADPNVELTDDDVRTGVRGLLARQMTTPAIRTT